MNVNELKQTARKVRIDALRGIHAASSGHPGGSLSSADIITALYFSVMNIDPDDPHMKGRDRFVLSKGHSCPALYAALANRGYFDPDEMLSFRRLGSFLQGHPNMDKCPGVEMSTGSLGQGFSVAVGMAIAGKMDGDSGRVFTMTGDGELQEGIIWEAALSAAKHGLDNLIAIVDWNNLQIDGVVDTVKKVAPVDEKFRAFGWEVFSCDGHDMQDILDTFDKALAVKGKPVCIVAKTVKGKGVSFMEDKAGWHGKAPDDEQLAQAIEELGGEK
ncbi:MAG: transketolase [Clostridiales bacterium]|nr:transketolase [Clostridiales bacterium]